MFPEAEKFADALEKTETLRKAWHDSHEAYESAKAELKEAKNALRERLASEAKKPDAPKRTEISRITGYSINYVSRIYNPKFNTGNEILLVIADVLEKRKENI